MKKPIRVLHIIGAMNRGGAETFLMELYRHIDRTKVQFDYLVYNYSNKPGVFDEEIKSLGGKIYNAKCKFYRNPISYCRELKMFFKEHPEYKIVHSHQNVMSGYSLSVAKKTTNPLTIAHSHTTSFATDFFHKVVKCIGRRLLRKNADVYFGCSKDAVFEISKRQPDNEKMFVINNAINIQKFSFNAKERHIWRENLCCNDDTFVMGNVARFTNEKNHKHLIYLFSDVISKKDDSLLVLVGDGPMREEIEELTKKIGIYEKVKFLGVRSDVQNIINSFDAFVMPSLHEGLGIVFIEAQANGLPCIMSADVIPEEADIGLDLVERVSLDESTEVWADACLNVQRRKSIEEITPVIIAAGYDIKTVSAWIQNFYIKHWI